MIYTVTFNPSLDYIVSVNNFQLGMTNRTATEMMLPGGKGINVSIVLKNLGLEIPHWDLWQDLPEMRFKDRWKRSE